MASKYWTSIICAIDMLVLLQLGGCATREQNNVHPYGDRIFQAPLIDINKYKSTHDRPANRKDLAVAVAISGGGERAANFAIGVLLQLEKIRLESFNSNALQELDYFSTVSGGGMAVAAYYSALYSHVCIKKRTRSTFSFDDAMRVSLDDLVNKCNDKNVAEYYSEFDRKQRITDPCLRRHLERGYHGNIAEAFFNPKTIFSNLDRGDVLEETFANELAGEQWNGSQLNLGQLFIPKEDGRDQQYPQWIANATVLENGAIFPFTPDVLSNYQVSGYVHKMKLVVKANAEDYFRFALKMPLSLGLTASGNFPSLITPQTLRSDQDQSNSFIHLIDGGVSDNLGLFTAFSILSQEKPNVKKVLIVIDAYPGNFSPYSNSESGPNFLQVYSKLPSLPLDGLRGRAREYIRFATELSGIKVFYLSFDDLYRLDSNNRFVENNSESEDLFKEIESCYPDHFILQPDQTITTLREKNPDKSPFEIARKVKTSYNITPAEQEFLIAVGRYLVAQDSCDIKIALSGN